jgi:hypothetical protein
MGDIENMVANDNVQDIFQLDLKINGLMEWAKTVGKKELGSRRALERAKVMPYSTLCSAMKSQRMSVSNQQKLATAFGFQIEWPEWRDPDAMRATAADRRRDGAKAFLDRFIARPPSDTCLTIDAAPTTPRVDYRVADYSFAVAGSFEPSPQAAGIPLVLSLSFDERGWSLVYDLTVRLTGVDLQIFPTRNGDPIRDTGVSVKLSELTCHIDAEGNFRGIVRGLQERPWWIISNPDGGCISGMRRRNDGRDCIVEGFRAGDEIRTKMTARVSDCFVSVSGQPFDDASEVKRKFIEHLSALEVLKGAEATLGEQILKVVEKS